VPISAPPTMGSSATGSRPRPDQRAVEVASDELSTHLATSFPVRHLDDPWKGGRIPPIVEPPAPAGENRAESDNADHVHTSTESGSSAPPLERGVRVYVRDRYLGRWSGGFKVAEVLSDGYKIRRLSDGHAFPDVFPFDDVRLERRHEPLRGIAGSHLDRRH
jgi:hypothetical protein